MERTDAIPLAAALGDAMGAGLKACSVLDTPGACVAAHLFLMNGHHSSAFDFTILW